MLIDMEGTNGHLCILSSSFTILFSLVITKIIFIGLLAAFCFVCCFFCSLTDCSVLKLRAAVVLHQELICSKFLENYVFFFGPMFLVLVTKFLTKF